MNAQEETVQKQTEEEKKAEEDYIKRIQELSYKIKKTPELYIKEIQKYVEDFKKFLVQVQQTPLQKHKVFTELSLFLCRMSSSFKLQILEDNIFPLVENLYNQMNPFLRKRMVSCILILRSKGLVQPLKSIQFLVKLLDCQDKGLRKLILSSIINDIKKLNLNHKNHKINSEIQAFFFQILKNQSDSIARRSLQLLITLYKKNIFNTPKSVNIIAQGCLNDNYKIKLIACYFLIETTEIRQEDLESSDEEDIEMPREKIGSKKTKGKENRLERDKKRAIRRQKRRLREALKKNFFPIDLINNAQDFCEKLFNVLKKSNEKFVVKLSIMSLLARMIGRNNLILPGFYSFLQKYLKPYQINIAKILAYLAESTHKYVAFEDMEQTVKILIDNFVSERCNEMSLTMGLNTIREMCQKNPQIIDSDQLSYICTFYTYKNKNVSKSAKSIINLYRDENPELLEKRFRGRATQITKVDLDKVHTTIEGSELIDEGSNIPICQERIFTDEDFKKIRFLQQKQKDKTQQKLIDEQIERQKQVQYIMEQDEENQISDEEDYENVSELSGEDLNSDDQEEEGLSGEEELKEEEGSIQEYEDLEEDSEYEDVEEEEGDQDEADLEEEDLEEKSAENEGKNQTNKGETNKVAKQQKPNQDQAIETIQTLTEEASKIPQGEQQQATQMLIFRKTAEIKTNTNDFNRKRRLKELKRDLEGFSDYSEEIVDEDNPHRFVSAEVIAKFRKTKSEAKKELQEQKLLEPKEKYYSGPKQKGGTSNNKEKLKNKPLSMLRPKKNKEKSRFKDIKRKIKDLKNKLGHVVSGKMAKKLKNKKAGF